MNKALLIGRIDTYLDLLLEHDPVALEEARRQFGPELNKFTPERLAPLSQALKEQHQQAVSYMRQLAHQPDAEWSDKVAAIRECLTTLKQLVRAE